MTLKAWPALKTPTVTTASCGRVDVPRHQRLQRRHDLGPDDDRVDRVLRLGAMSALPANGDGETIGGGHCRTGAHLDHTDRRVLVDVDAEGRIDLRILQHARFDHRLGATGGQFLRRLEEEFHRTGKVVATLQQQSRRAQEHGGVGVVTAGVHDAGRLRSVVDLVLFKDRKRIHIGAQQDCWPIAALAAADETGHAGLGYTGAHVFDAEGAQPVRHDAGRAEFLVSQFRMLVQITPVGDHAGQDLVDVLPQSCLNHLVGPPLAADRLVVHHTRACRRSLRRPEPDVRTVSVPMSC